MNLTNKFISELYYLGNRRLTKQEITSFQLFLIDYLGVTLAGSVMLREKTKQILNSNPDIGVSTAIGLDKNVSIEKAILLNGLNSHVAELDDGIIESSVHPGAPLLSVLLPVAEQNNLTIEDLGRGILTGYEAISRLSKSIQPSHKIKGYHASSTCGAVGSAIGIGSMMKVDEEEMRNIFSASVISVSGSLKAIEDNSELKPLNIANASLNAFRSYIMGKAGFKGPEDVLSGNRGFFSLMADNSNPGHLFNKESNFSVIKKVYVKPYAACRYCHPAIDAVLNLRSIIKDLREIKVIHVKTYDLAVNKHDHVNINNISSAKMSIPFSCAVALVNGSANIEDYSDKTINNPKIVELTQKVKVSSSQEFSTNFPSKSEALVKITMKDGTRHECKIDYPLGEPENPLSQKQILSKFESLVKYCNKIELKTNSIINNIQNNDTQVKDLLKDL